MLMSKIGIVLFNFYPLNEIVSPMITVTLLGSGRTNELIQKKYSE